MGVDSKLYWGGEHYACLEKIEKTGGCIHRRKHNVPAEIFQSQRGVNDTSVPLVEEIPLPRVEPNSV